MQQRWKILLCLIVVGLCLAGRGAFAQDEIQAGAAEWDSTAQRAEEAIRNGRASNEALEALRSEIAAQRAEAFNIIQGGDITTLTLQAQLDALGPAPKTDETEPAEIAARRAALENRLAIANEPILEAKQAYGRAEVLIGEIDKLIRARLKTDLFERSPTPIWPTRWLTAASELSAYFRQVYSEVEAALAVPSQAMFMGQRAPVSAVLVVLGLLLLLLVQPVLLRRVERSASSAQFWIRRTVHMATAIALRFLIPAAGAILLLSAFLIFNITPYSARSVNSIAISAPFLLVVPYWLGHILFSPTLPERRIVNVDNPTARSAVRICIAMGGLLFVEAALEAAERDYSFTPASRSVLAALVVVAGSLFLWRLAALLLRADRPDDGDVDHAVSSDPGEAARIDFLPLIARIVQLVAVLAVVFVAVGYVQISRQAIVPMILSLGLLGFALAVYRLLMSAANATLGSAGLAGVFALLPFAIGAIVFLASLPILALTWGARQADISEIWILVTQGVEVGGTRISVGFVFTLLSVFIVGLLATRWLQRLLGSTVLPRTRLDSGGRNAVITGLGYAGVAISALAAIAVAGLDLSNIAIVFGALSVGIGFGLQAVVSNFVSGIILLIERPIKEGDWIEVSGYSGIVRKIAVRSTRIETFDRHDVILPNSDLIAGTVKNMTLDSRTGRLVLPVGVAYGSDLDATKKTLLEVAQNHKQVMSHPEPVVLFTGLGESSLDFELRCFLGDVYSVLSVRSELLFDIYRELNNLGIEIPFPQRDINVRNVEEIAKAVTSEAARQNVRPQPDV